MPRTVRNFWLEINVDGRKSRVTTGPRNRTGGFDCTIYMRCDGEVTRALELRGRESGGVLTLTVEDPGTVLSIKRTRR